MIDISQEVNCNNVVQITGSLASEKGQQGVSWDFQKHTGSPSSAPSCFKWPFRFGSAAPSSEPKSTAPSNDPRDMLKASRELLENSKSSLQQWNPQVAPSTLQKSLRKSRYQRKSYASFGLASHAADQPVSPKSPAKARQMPADTLSISKHSLREQIRHEQIEKLHAKAEGILEQFDMRKQKGSAHKLRTPKIKGGKTAHNITNKEESATEKSKVKDHVDDSLSAYLEANAESNQHDQNVSKQDKLLQAAQQLVRPS
jgi:hypothetical protein